MTSIECLSSGRQFVTPERTQKIECGCCHATRDRGHYEHDVLGELCVYCAITFDPKIDHRPRTRWQRYRHENACATCIEGGECALHPA